MNFLSVVCTYKHAGGWCWRMVHGWVGLLLSLLLLPLQLGSRKAFEQSRKRDLREKLVG